MEKEKKCNCDEKCTCGCNEGKECTCTDEKCTCGCSEGKECTCGDDCDCKENNCTCNEDCCCDDVNKKKNKKEKKDKHKEKINELENKVKSLEDELLRNKAEVINYRKRKDEEVSRLLKYSNEDLINEMLPIIDTFENAIKMDDDNLDDEVSKFLSGFKMMYCNLISVLEHYGVKEIDGANKPFDPTYHQAVMQEASERHESGYVIEVLRKGYILKDKVIRPAMVKVSE